MQAAVIAEFGDPEGIDVQEMPAPRMDEDEVRIDVTACALNHRDLKRLYGSRLEATDLPRIQGSDVAGTIVETGSAVNGLRPGDRVVRCPNITCGVCTYCREGPENRCEHYEIAIGGFAEECVAPADRVIPLPSELEMPTAAALPITYMTAQQMIDHAQLRGGDRIFIPGVSGGVGIALAQLAKVIGVETVGTTGSAEKMDRLQTLGVDRVIHADDPDAIREVLTDEPNFDASFNFLSGEFTQLCLDVLRRGGRTVTCGQTVGRTSDIDMLDLYWGHKHLIGTTMGTQTDLERAVQLAGKGAIAPAIDRQFSLEEASQAFAALENREVVGNILLCPGG